MPIEISNLGPDASNRYARDKEALAESHYLLESDISVSRHAEIDITAPYYESEFEQLFQLSRRHSHIAAFIPPEGFEKQRRSLFSTQWIAHLGSLEKQEALIEKLSEFASKNEEEKKALVSSLKLLLSLNKQLIDIKSLRDQYQKG